MGQGTCEGTPVLGKHDRWSRNLTARPPGDPPRQHQGAERGPTDPQPPRRPVALRRPQRGVAQLNRVLLDPGGLGPHLLGCIGGPTLQTRHQRRSRRRPHPHVGGGHLGHGARRGGGGRLPPPAIRRPAAMGPYGGRRSHPPPIATSGSRADHRVPRGRGGGSQPDTPAVAEGRHPFWYVRATSHHSDTLLHKGDLAASQDTVLQNTPPGPSHAQLIVSGHDGHLNLRPPRMLTLGKVAQRAQTDDALTHRGHTPLGAAHATAYVHARDLTASATNHRALRARDRHTPVQRRLCVRKERLSSVAVLPQPCLLCCGPEETLVHMHVGCAHSRLLWPHYRQAVHEAARHLPPGDKALWVASWRSAGAA